MEFIDLTPSKKKAATQREVDRVRRKRNGSSSSAGKGSVEVGLKFLGDAIVQASVNRKEKRR
jgi:hypothetical protein